MQEKACRQPAPVIFCAGGVRGDRGVFLVFSAPVTDCLFL
jgi:hypothetical protein